MWRLLKLFASFHFEFCHVFLRVSLKVVRNWLSRIMKINKKLFWILRSCEPLFLIFNWKILRKMISLEKQPKNLHFNHNQPVTKQFLPRFFRFHMIRSKIYIVSEIATKVALYRPIELTCKPNKLQIWLIMKLRLHEYTQIVLLKRYYEIWFVLSFIGKN